MFGPENIWLVASGFGAIFVAVVAYMVGGTDMDGPGPMGGQKWIRRYFGASVLSSAANGIAFLLGVWAWQYLLMFPALMIGFSLPYGGNTVAVKTLKRFVFAVGVLAACFCGLWATGFTFMGWVVMALASGIGLGSVVLGVMNPFSNAPLEQGLICLVLTMFVPFWAFIK
jgi:hypothetical protein